MMSKKALLLLGTVFVLLVAPGYGIALGLGAVRRPFLSGAVIASTRCRFQKKAVAMVTSKETIATRASSAHSRSGNKYSTTKMDDIRAKFTARIGQGRRGPRRRTSVAVSVFFRSISFSAAMVLVLAGFVGRQPRKKEAEFRARTGLDLEFSLNLLASMETRFMPNDFCRVRFEAGRQADAVVGDDQFAGRDKVQRAAVRFQGIRFCAL